MAGWAWGADPTPLQGYRVRQWTSQQGLPGNSVAAVLRSASGRIWVATMSGLAWTDGASVHAVPLEGPRTGFWSLVEGEGQGLWLGGQDGRVWSYAGQRFQDHSPPEPLGANAIVALDRQGNLWAGGTRGLWRRYDGVWSRAGGDLLGAAEVMALAPSRDGSVWVGTRAKGLWRVVAGAAPPRAYPLAQGGCPEEIPSLAEAPDGRLWVATNELGVLQVQDSHLVPGITPSPKLGVPTILLEPDGALWMTTDRGIFKWDGQHLERLVEPAPRSGVRFRGLARDPEGSLWVGSRVGGLLQLRPSPFRVHQPPGPSLGVVNAVAEGPGGLWVAAARGGLLWLGPQGYEPLPKLNAAIPPDSYFKDVLQDGDGTLWICTNNGLYRVPKGGAPQRVPLPDLAGDAYVRVAFHARDGSHWFGTQRGLYRLREGRFRSYSGADGLGHPYILSLQEDRRGRLLVGTNGGGLNLLEGDRFRALRTSEGLPSDIVFRIHVDADDTWWIGTSVGLARYKDGRFQGVPLGHQGPDESIYQVLETASGHLWLCAPSGLKRLDKAAIQAHLERGGTRPEVETFGEDEGVEGATSVGHSLVDGEGVLAVATVGGLVRLDPRRQQRNALPPPVEITGVSSAGRSLFPGEELRLPSRSDLEIHFSAYSFLTPSRVRFRYLLEGLDPVWRDSGTRREAFFTRLPPGRYRFRVQACNNDGLWNEAPSPLPLVVLPRWFETRWFRLLLAVASLGLVAGAVAARTRVLKEQAARLERVVAQRTAELVTAHAALETANHDLEARVQERTWELREALNLAQAADRAKSAFLARMSHELRTPLNHMVLYTQLLREEWASATKQPPPSDFEVIERAGRGLDALILELMTYTDLESGRLALDRSPLDLGSLLEALEARFRPAAAAKGLGFSIERTDPLPTHLTGDPKRLDQVMGILVSNALKFTSQGEVRLRLRVLADTLRLEVEDTGPGIAEADRGRIFDPLEQADGSLARGHGGVGLGLAIAKRLVERMGGQIGHEAREGGGSRFWIALP